MGARVWDRVGVTSFQPLLAPMLVDSQALQAKVFSSGIAATTLAGVDASGLVGIGLLPGPLRKVLGVSAPFRRPSDFAGRVVGLQDGQVAEKALEALGATPRAVPAGAELGGLDGYEQQLGSIWGNHYELTAKYVTANLNLWPRPLVLFTAKAVIASLTAAQRSALRAAATATLSSAGASAEADDEGGVPGLCQGGLRLSTASGQQLRALRAAVQPVYDELNADPQTRAVIRSIEAIKTRLGADPDTATCAGQPASGRTSPRSGVIPDGTYQMTLTDKEAKKCAGDESNPGRRFDLQLHKGGVQLWEQVGAGPREMGWYGSYRVFRDRFELIESPGHSMTTHWAFDGKALTLSDLRNGECGDATVWTTHPWVLKRET